MPILKLPKSIKWLFACAILVLIFLSVYRIVCFNFFKQYFTGAHQNFGSLLWLGFRFDCKLVSLVTFFLFLLSVFPATHLFKTSLGKHTAFVVYTLFIAVLLVFYIGDFISLVSFKVRLQGRLFSEIARNTEKGLEFKKHSPWFAIVVVVIVCSWLFYLLIKFIHKQIGKKRSGADDKVVRTYWQILLLFLCLVGFWGRIGRQPLKSSNASTRIPATAVQLALTPVQSFMETLADRKQEDASKK